MTRSPSKRIAAGAAAAVLAAGLGLGLAKTSVLAAAEPPAAPPLMVDNFRLTDQNLQSHELYRLRSASAVVIITQMDGCPVIRNEAAAIKRLKDEYAAKGVEFMMLNSTPSDSRDEILQEAKDYGFDLPILLDRNQLVGEQLGVKRTAEVYVINPKTWRVVYHGPVDDKVTYERQKAKADHEYARDAIEAVLTKTTPAVAQEETAGCLINFTKAAADAAPTYTAAIAPIIQSKCVVCHQPGGIGPMPLTSYEKVKAYAPMIREVLRTQRMPPWRADPSVGHFEDDKSLSSEQIRTMVHWVEAGAPRGAGADTLAAVEYHAAEWPLGKPDLVLDIPAYKIPANGVVDYQRPFVLNPLKVDKWVRASTIKVDNRQAVHHILTGYIAEPPAPGQQAFEDKWGVSVGGYAVGAESEVAPTDVGTLLPAGGAIGFQNHYTPYGKEVVENSKIALYFYDKTPKLMMHNSVIANPNISIPPNEEAHPEVAYIVFPKDALLYSAFPHAHYRGASSTLSIRYPDGKEKVLLALPHYDFNWQRDYTFDSPIKVPAGSWLIARYTYDNSKRNPANPDPNRTVPWGEQSFDEMLYTALHYRWVDETSAHPVNYDQALNASRLMGMLDSNLDGKIELAELRGKMGENLKANFKMIDKDGDGSIDMAELSAVQAYMRAHRRQGPPPPQQAAAPPPAPAVQQTSGTTR